MRFRTLRRAWLVLILTSYVFAGQTSVAPDQPALSREQIEHFLLTAKVIRGERSGKGITDPWRLTLSDGTVAHDASFQTVDKHKIGMQFSDGGTELMFVDSYKYNIAAYQLAELLGLEDMLPVFGSNRCKAAPGIISDFGGALQTALTERICHSHSALTVRTLRCQAHTARHTPAISDKCHRLSAFWLNHS